MPLRDDMIQRTIEQIVQVIAWVMGQRDEKAYAEAVEVIEAAYREHTGSGRELLTHLSSDDLIGILSTAGRFDREKGYLIATLLRAETTLLEVRHMAVPPELQLKALDLFLEVRLEGLDLDDLPEQIGELQAALAEFSLPQATLLRLFEYRRLQGGFVGAEDALYELLERFGADDEMASRGRAFYRDLAQLSGPKLRAGGLSPEGVEVGRDEFERALTEKDK